MALVESRLNRGDKGENQKAELPSSQKVLYSFLVDIAL